MQTRTPTVVAALMAFAAVANGHITMKSPAPFGSIGPNKKITSSPLTSANYPCQVGSDPNSFYSKEGLDNKMQIGQPQTISFEGSAVHGGGSCQLALTKDPQPSVSTSWMTILSIEGGCPSKTGTGTDEYQFTIPDGISPGDYVFAWTWISKLSGTQEFYMNCAPVTITGGSKRDVSQNETMDLFPRDAAFPELMVANLAGINDCKSQLSTDPVYPNPGTSVMKPGSSNSFAPISGSNCVPKGAKDVTPPSGSGSGSASGSASSSAPAASSAPAVSSAPASSAALTSVSAPATVPASSTGSLSSFLTLTITAPSGSSAVSSSRITSASSMPNATATPTLSPSSAPAPASSAPASSAPSSSAPASSGEPTPGSGAQGLTGPCQQEGVFNCIGGTSYQQCASGSWSVVMAMPPTTKCAIGQTTTLWGRSEGVNERNSFHARRRV